MRISLLFILFAACGGPLKVTPEARTVFNEFADDAILHGQTLDYSNLQIVLIDELPLGQYGRCWRGIHSFFGGYRTVQLQRNMWTNGTDTDRKLVLYHELGHCVLGQEHHGVEIMQAGYSVGGFFNNEEKWIDDLFSD